MVLLYLIDNLGKDVPVTAPLYGALSKLRQEVARRLLQLPLPAEIEQKAKGVYAERVREGAAIHERLRSLRKELRNEKLEVLREKFHSSDPSECAIAIQVAGERRLPVEVDLAECLKDTDEHVVRAAHSALVRLSRGTDFGSPARVSPKERERRISRWEKWAALQKAAAAELQGRKSLSNDVK